MKHRVLILILVHCFLSGLTEVYGFQADNDLEQKAEKAEAFYPADLDSSIILADQVLAEISSRDLETPLEERMLDMKGWALRRSGDRESGEEYLLEALELSLQRENREQLGKTYHRLGYLYWQTGRYPESLEYYNQSVEIRTELGDQRSLAGTLNNIGNVYIAIEQPDKAFEYYTKSIEVREQLGDKEYLSSAIMNLGIWFARQNKFEEALYYMEQYHAIQVELKDTLAMASATMNIGNVNNVRGNYDAALEYYLEAVSLLNKSSIKRETTRTDLLFNIGNLYSKTGYHDKAISSTKEALNNYIALGQKSDIGGSYQNIGHFFDEKNEPDSALFYYKRSLAIYEELGLDNNRADILLNMGVVYNKQGAPEFALQYLEQAEAVFLAEENEAPLANLYNNIGASYYYMGQFDRAINEYLKSYEYATKTENLKTQGSATFGLAEAYGETGDYKNAFEYQLLYDTYKDSLMNLERAEAIEELITKYETEQKEAEIELLTAQQAQNEAEIARQDAENRALFFGILALVFVVTGITGWYIYSSRKKKIIQQQKEALYQNEIESLIEKQSLESISAMLEGQEKERNRLAAELHDRLGSILSLVKMYFSSLDDDLKEKQPELYQSFSEGNQILDDAFAEVRALIKEMKEGKISGQGLEQDITALLQKIENLGVEIDAEIQVRTELSSNIEMNVFRIIQEALSNALKYSKASKITLKLIEKEELQLTIIDNGIGFDPEQSEQYTHEMEHYGLGNMESRVTLLGGSFHLDSEPGRGVTISANIPVQYEPEEVQ